MEFSEKEVMTEALERVVSKTNLPGSFFLKLLRDLKAAYSEHQNDVTRWTKLFESSEEKIERLTKDAEEAIEALENTSETHISTINALVAQVEETIAAREAAIHEAITEREPAIQEAIDRLNAVVPEKGEAGKTPVLGKDYFTKRDQDTILARLMGRIQKPKDGDTPIVNTEAIVEEILERLKENNFATQNDIERITTEVASYRNQLAGKAYGKDTFVRGGGDTVKAGTNVIITRNAAGDKVISAIGGSGGSSVTTQYSLTAVQSGANVTIALSQLTNFATYVSLIAVYRNNIMQTETLNFTQTPTVVTVLDADASEIFNITYAYA